MDSPYCSCKLTRGDGQGARQHALRARPGHGARCERRGPRAAGGVPDVHATVRRVRSHGVLMALHGVLMALHFRALSLCRTPTAGELSWPTTCSGPMDNPYCSCELITRVRSRFADEFDANTLLRGGSFIHGLAVGESSVIPAAPSSPCSGCFNTDGEGSASRMTELSPAALGGVCWPAGSGS